MKYYYILLDIFMCVGYIFVSYKHNFMREFFFILIKLKDCFFFIYGNYLDFPFRNQFFSICGMCNLKKIINSG